jgi:hypothetical protein
VHALGELGRSLLLQGELHAAHLILAPATALNSFTFAFSAFFKRFCMLRRRGVNIRSTCNGCTCSDVSSTGQAHHAEPESSPLQPDSGVFRLLRPASPDAKATRHAPRVR